MSLYFADLQVFDVFFCGSGILAFYRKIICDILSGILSGIRVQACPTAFGAGDMVPGGHSTVQKEDGSDGRE